MNTETRNELIINVNYIKSINYDGGTMLDFVPSEYNNHFRYDEIGEQYYQRPLMKITTESETFTLSFADDSTALEYYMKLRGKLSSSESPFYCIDLNSPLYRVAYFL